MPKRLEGRYDRTAYILAELSILSIAILLIILDSIIA